jgi:hypothetical protein
VSSQAPGIPPAEVPPGKQGCAKNALLGCGVAALVLFALLVGCFLYLRRNPALLTDVMMKQIESHYGPDVTEQDKADLKAAYGDFRSAVNEKRVNREAVGRLQSTLSSNRSNRLGREDVQALTRAFREGAGKAPAAPEPSASPAPAATPPP